MTSEAPTIEQYAELVGYTGHNECMEIRQTTSGKQVWDHATDYGVGLGLGRIGYWVGTEHEHRFSGRNRSDVVAEYEDYLGTPVRWVS